MKKTIILGLALVLGVVTYAQPGEVTNAVLYHKNGQLMKAKTSIDKATKHEKTGVKSKTWYYSGLIYMDMAKKNEDNSTKYDQFSVANTSFQKAIDLNAGETWVSQSKSKRRELYSTVFNIGVNFHSSSDFENALKFDELAAAVQVPKVEDRVNALINATIAASNLQLDDKSIELNKKILELKPDDAETYVELILLHDRKGDLDKALEYAETGSNKFPKDTRFTNEVARLAIKSGKGDEAISKLKVASEKDPQNTLYLNKIADLYDKSGKTEEAESYYKKALAIDANNLDANYNLGSIYFNRGANAINEINDMDLKEYQKNGDAKEKEAKGYFEQCIPHYEKAYNQLDDAGKSQLKPALMKAYMKAGKDEDADKL